MVGGFQAFDLEKLSKHFRCAQLFFLVSFLVRIFMSLCIVCMHMLSLSLGSSFQVVGGERFFFA